MLTGKLIFAIANRQFSLSLSPLLLYRFSPFSNFLSLCMHYLHSSDWCVLPLKAYFGSVFFSAHESTLLQQQSASFVSCRRRFCRCLMVHHLLCDRSSCCSNLKSCLLLLWLLNEAVCLIVIAWWCLVVWCSETLNRRVLLCLPVSESYQVCFLFLYLNQSFYCITDTFLCYFSYFSRFVVLLFFSISCFFFFLHIDGS